MNKRGLILLLTIIVLSTVVYAGTTPPNCKIESSACNNGFTTFGYVTSDGHFTENDDIISPTTFYLCCKDLDKGSGTTSFRYTYDSIINQGHVSINSTKTNFTNEVKMGFQKQCTIKDSCTASEVCLFRVCDSSPSCRLNSSNPYSIDNTHIADCNNQNIPFSNDFTKRVCCEFTEICSDGKDNDGDGYIDCADQECKQTLTGQSPLFCTGSAYNSDACVVNHTVNPVTGVITVLYNESCIGELPYSGGTLGVRTPPSYLNSEKAPIWYCSYGKVEDPTSGNPGLCCQEGTYAKQDEFGVWYCEGSAQCGLQPSDKCLYDFDLNGANWKASTYAPTNPKWCQSKFPYYFTPLEDEMEYPQRSTGCCLLEYHGEVDYYTHQDNVKIFGYEKYCGDGIIDFDKGEECDSNNVGTCLENGFSCPPNYVAVGVRTCSNCRISTTTCSCSIINY